MDISTFAVAAPILTLFVVGVVELVKQAFNRNWKAVVTIIAAAAVGGIGGLVLLPTIGLAVGISIGLSASGFVTSLQNIGTGTVKTEVQ